MFVLYYFHVKRIDQHCLFIPCKYAAVGITYSQYLACIFNFVMKHRTERLFLANRFGVSVPLTFLGAYLGFKKKVCT